MISVITCTMRDNNMHQVFRNYSDQSFEEKELIIVLNHDAMDIEKWKQEATNYPNVRVYQLPGWVTLGECMNYAVRRAKYDFIAKFDDDDYYAAGYLDEAMEVFNNTDVHIVGKRTVFVYMVSSQSLMLRAKPQMENVRDATLVFKKEVWKKVRFRPLNKKSFWNFQNKAREKGFIIDSSSRYNYVYLRRSPDDHTFNIKHENFLKKCQFLLNVDNFIPYVERDIETKDSDLPK